MSDPRFVGSLEGIAGEFGVSVETVVKWRDELKCPALDPKEKPYNVAAIKAWLNWRVEDQLARKKGVVDYRKEWIRLGGVLGIPALAAYWLKNSDEGKPAKVVWALEFGLSHDSLEFELLGKLSVDYRLVVGGNSWIRYGHLSSVFSGADVPSPNAVVVALPQARIEWIWSPDPIDLSDVDRIQQLRLMMLHRCKDLKIQVEAVRPESCPFIFVSSNETVPEFCQNGIDAIGGDFFTLLSDRRGRFSPFREPAWERIRKLIEE